MPQPPDDPVLIAFQCGTLLLSLATCVVLLAARVRGPLLQFRPRRLVPWNASGGGVAFLLVFFTLVAAIANLSEQQAADDQNKSEAASSDTSPKPTNEDNASDIVLGLVTFIVQELILVGGILILIAVYFHASRCDLGLPANATEFAQDAGIGLIAGLAALTPILILQALLMFLFGGSEMKSGHPLVKMVEEGGPNAIIALLATVSAVVVAPVCEEIAFRLLLQGWLEKWEARGVGLIQAEPLLDFGPEGSVQPCEGTEITNDECRITNVADRAATHASSVNCDTSLDAPPPQGLAGLPFGWLPIGITSLLFGLAHFGYGPEPVPLFFLALVLGYLYYRTHRIVPCIVAHATFNSFTMVLLWRMMFHGAH